MMTKVSKTYKWEMGHRLTFHEGPCRNIHGHTYRMRLDIEGEPDDKGMVIDYYDMDKVVLPFLEQLDHAFLCDDKDMAMIEFLKAGGLKLKILPFYSTAENIAGYIMNELYPLFRSHGKLKSITVRVHETEDVFAEIIKEL